MINMTVEKVHGDWFVIEDDGTWMAGPFQTNDQAWRWYDRHFSAGAFDAEHRNAVRTKINEDGALW
jgi:hypothetical protein